MILFDVYLKEGISSDSLLSDEVKQSTGAQLMTADQAAFVGLEGIPDAESELPRVLIACGSADERLVHTRIERNEGVASFRVLKLG